MSNSVKMEYHKSLIGYDLGAPSNPIGFNVMRNRVSRFPLKNIKRKSRVIERYIVTGRFTEPYANMQSRHISDKVFKQKNFSLRPSLDFIGQKYICQDSSISSSRCASYSGFYIPLRMRCLANYIQAGRKYEEQFQKEIRNLVDNQTSALEACQFVRMMSYTTLWPPLHNAKELASTSKKFFPLDKKKKRRLQKIMTTDYT